MAVFAQSCDQFQMEFRLIYSGPLYAANSGKDRSRPARVGARVHPIRKNFHKQLKELWRVNRILSAYGRQLPESVEHIPSYGFNWRPLATVRNNVLCKVDVLMLRPGDPGGVITDIDNRLKTLFDALQIPSAAAELASPDNAGGQMLPASDEEPFFVALENDKLISHVSVSTDTLLEPLPGVAPEHAVHLVVTLTLRPTDGTWDHLHFL